MSSLADFRELVGFFSYLFLSFALDLARGDFVKRRGRSQRRERCSH
jgi:hypothetical protein